MCGRVRKGQSWWLARVVHDIIMRRALGGSCRRKCAACTLHAILPEVVLARFEEGEGGFALIYGDRVRGGWRMGNADGSPERAEPTGAVVGAERMGQKTIGLDVALERFGQREELVVEGSGIQERVREERAWMEGSGRWKD